MAISSISFSFGSISFAGEAENEEWLTEQVDKVLELASKSPSLVAQATQKPSAAASAGEKFTGTLASYLREKNAVSNQVKRFLATADWLRLRGSESLNTSMVSKALSDNHQSRLGNPAECLNKNVAKGCCEKTADGFFITQEGFTDLGYE
jgi:hypothetical protein